MHTEIYQLFTSLRKSIILPFCAFYVLRTKTIINRDKLIVGCVGVDRFISVNRVGFGLFFSLVGFGSMQLCQLNCISIFSHLDRATSFMTAKSHTVYTQYLSIIIIICIDFIILFVKYL